MVNREGIVEENQNRPLELYFRALSGNDVTIEHYALEDKAHYPDTPTTIRLPRATGKMPKRSFYRLALAHRALHAQLGTFDFRIDRLSNPFVRDHLTPSAEDASELEVFFAAFSDVPLAKFLFEILEDARIDARLPLEYPGLKSELQSAVRFEFLLRPDWNELPPRGAAVEFALRRSMDPVMNQAPQAIAEPAQDISTIFGSLNLLEATVEDIAAACVQAYSVVNLLPNLGVLGNSPAKVLDSSDSPHSLDSLWPRKWPEDHRVRLEGDDVLLISLPGVTYRGSIGSFLIKAPSASGPDHQALYRLRNVSDIEEDGEIITAKSKTSGPPEPLPHDHHDVSRHLHHHEEGELAPHGSNTFLYPEWDKYQGRYRRNWCRVVQTTPPGGGALERSTLQIRYAKELRRLRRAMDIPLSQAFVTERRTPDGPDIDYDAAVEAMIDFRTGGEASDSVYQDLRRTRRDISVLLLIDVSASTAERVEDAELIESALSPDILLGPKLRPPRILDIEVISSLLCSSALNTVGDAFSVWSFSGTGRERVILSEIKGFNEPMSGIVVSRASAMKPIHATRLGAAVRHCGKVLSKLQSQTKVLLILTDGRPFDIDYGTSYGEGESQSYALADSDKALSELEAFGIEPYVLTVDPSGEEYVSEFKSAHVEVLEDINSLPEKLLRLYKSLLDRNIKSPLHKQAANGAKTNIQSLGGHTR
ncbi:MAG: hypothetical protein EPN30_09880 [Actinomycetota bacterium]|nr:MAG: hypothetical protein EPN30_09880 [Actinomycetota bacterium]